jgi:hypothetical protein
MALKRKINKADYEKLDKAIQLEYKVDGDDFVLDAEGFEDVTPLKRAKDREVQLHNETKEELKTANEELKILRKANGDIATLEKSWQKKFDDSETKHKDEVTKLRGHVQVLSSDGEAVKLASTLAGDNAQLLLPHIKARLVTDLDGDKPLVRVLDKEGKPSALSLGDLEKEFREDKRFSPVVIASKASGSGASGSGGTGGNGGAGTSQKKFHELNDKERTDWYKSDQAGFQKAAADYKASLRPY